MLRTVLALGGLVLTVGAGLWLALAELPADVPTVGAADPTQEAARLQAVAIAPSEGRVVVQPAPRTAPPREASRVVGSPSLHAVDILAVEGATGTPVKDYAVRRGRSPSGLGAVSHHGRHEGGVVRMRFAAGPHSVKVIPSEDGLWPSELVEFEVTAAGPAVVRIEVHRAVPIPVRVVRRNGLPVGRTRVELLRRPDGDASTITASTPVVAPWDDLAAGAEVGRAVQLDEGWTDAEGRAELRGPPLRELCVVRAMGPGHLPGVQGGVAVARNAAPVVVVVTEGATLRGVVRPRGFASRPSGVAGWRPSRVWLRQLDDPLEPWFRDGDAWEVDERGFEIHDVPPGNWQVLLSKHAPARGMQIAGVFKSPVARVQLLEGRTTDIEVEAPDLRPGRIRGFVRHRGVALARARVFLWWMNPDPVDGNLLGGGPVIETDDEGRFEAVDLVPARYCVLVDFSGVMIAARQLVQLPPGRDVQQVFEVETTRLVLRLLEADGVTPASDCTVKLTDERSLKSAFRRGWDDEGRVVFDPAPVGQLSLVVYTAGPNGRAGITLPPVTVSRDQLEVTVERRIPGPLQPPR